jgi:osmotically-inducible protein OsmY
MSPQFFVHPAHDLAELVERTLSRQRTWWGRCVEARVAEDGDVQLTGRVGTYYQKQMAQEFLRGLHGIGRICNELQVVTNG